MSEYYGDMSQIPSHFPQVLCPCDTSAYKHHGEVFLNPRVCHHSKDFLSSTLQPFFFVRCHFCLTEPSDESEAVAPAGAGWVTDCSSTGGGVQNGREHQDRDKALSLQCSVLWDSNQNAAAHISRFNLSHLLPSLC